ncbi:MAG: DNA-directed DNA polymerase II small subunit [Halodesulfurarchaeum sp.]
MPRASPVRIVKQLTAAGLNAEREAVTLLAGAPDPDRAVEAVLDQVGTEAVTITAADVRPVLEDAPSRTPPASASEGGTDTADSEPASRTPSETSEGGSASIRRDRSDGDAAGPDRDPVEPVIRGDVTGESTGTGEYEDFVSVFRDRYERLAAMLRGRVKHRPTDALESMPAGSEGAVIGLVSEVRSTRNGHRLIELEDTNGTFPALVMKDREFASAVDELLLDEVIAVRGTLSDDGGLLFADDLFFPDVPRTFEPTTADRHVQAALVSDLHVGSQEFRAGAWADFADWLSSPEAEAVEYLLIAGDLVEGVGVYPDQDEELDVIDIYEQYERFSERLKAVPGDLEIVMIPGNHDAVRLAEPQPAFDPELREIMSAHDARISGNPSTVTIEGVSILLYHGVSLDEVVAELPLEEVSYDRPDQAMAQLLKKRHVAPAYGGKNRIAPETRDYLLIEDVPDVMHSGHVHKLGVGAYHGVRLVNSGCFQGQTSFQRSVNITPDVGTVPVLDLDTLDVTVRKFA